MATNLNTREYSPISSKQSTLHKFFPSLSYLPLNRSYVIDQETSQMNIPPSPYHYELHPDNRIEIQETHCLTCNMRLVKNGFNNRFIIFDQNRGTYHFLLHRKRCPFCGEIPINLSQFAPKFGNYNENFKRRCRQLYMEGLTPTQIQQSFHKLCDIWISKSSLVNWINTVADSIDQLMEKTIVPSSGTWAHDEIFLRISKKKEYALVLLDTTTNFVIRAKVSPSLDRGSGNIFLQEAKRKNRLPIKTIIKDGGMIFGNLFSKRNYKKIRVQLCKVHMKWLINRYMKRYAGMSVQSKKSLPSKYHPIRNQFYRIIEATHETAQYAAVEALRLTVQCLDNKIITNGFRRVEGQLPRFINHLRDPTIPLTNNKLENFNQFLERYPSMKRRMKTSKGCQRVLNYRAFKQNMGQFIRYKYNLIKRIQNWVCLRQETDCPRWLKGQGMHFAKLKRILSESYASYLRFWNDSISILKYN